MAFPKVISIPRILVHSREYIRLAAFNVRIAARYANDREVRILNSIVNTIPRLEF